MPANTFVSSGAREMLNKSEGERSSIISSALTFLKLYRDPIIAANTRGHDFTINDIRQLLLLLDEFPLFGRLQFFEKTLRYSSGYNIRCITPKRLITFFAVVFPLETS